MKEINGYLLVDVPEDLKVFKIANGKLYGSMPEVPGSDWEITILPKGNYSIIGLLSEIPEKDLPEDVWQEIANTITEEKLSISNCLILKKIL